jgi:hypothetical protein
MMILAPLQREMLNTSAAGCHVQQVELMLDHAIEPAQVIAAWAQTVAQTDALRIHFPTNESWQWAPVVQPLQVEDSMGVSREVWLAQDRQQPLGFAEQVPWRAVYWPADGRIIWTFHHALLDGRSMTRVLQNFLDRILGEQPGPLSLARWEEPTEQERQMARHEFGSEISKWMPLRSVGGSVSMGEGKVRRQLGGDLLNHLIPGKTTVPTLLVWAWGQALMVTAGVDVVVVEQIRAGPPQPRTAGFTMNSLPVLIRHARNETLLEFQNRLRALRAIERAGPADFPEMDRSECSVIMVEHGTLRHQVGRSDRVKELRLHEPISQASTAMAYLMPDFTLEVEGPNREALLEAWVREIEGSVV